MMSFIKKLKKLKSWQRRLLEVSLIIIIFFSVRWYQHQDILSGKALPVQGVLLNKAQIDWSAYQGKPLLVHFWATWCSICRLEEESIQAISKDYNVLSIASWSEDTAAYMQQKGLDFPVLNDVDGYWAGQYGIKAVPSSFIVDSGGDIKFVETGYSSETGLRLRLWWLQL